MPLTAGTISFVSKTTTTASLSATEATGGTQPIASRQWYRNTTGLAPAGGDAVTGATGLTLSDTGLTPDVIYYYFLNYVDSASAVVGTGIPGFAVATPPTGTGSGTGLTPSGSTIGTATTGSFRAVLDAVIAANPSAITTGVARLMRRPREGQAQQVFDRLDNLAAIYFGGLPASNAEMVADLTAIGAAVNGWSQAVTELVALATANAGTLVTAISPAGTRATTTRTFP